jgi:small GTP-binding protein
MLFQRIGFGKMGEIKHKIVVIGAPAVGKTSLVRKYTKGEFQKEYISTLGAQFSRYEEKIENNIVELIIWDIAGQEAWETMRKKFYIGSSAGIVVFSHAADEIESISDIQKWMDELKSNCGEIPVMLFGNKIDLIDTDELEKNDKLLGSDFNIDQLIKKHGIMGYFKTSALTGDGVNEAFQSLVHKLYYESK